MLITLITINTILLILLVFKDFNLQVQIQSLLSGLRISNKEPECFIEELNPAEERIAAFRERMIGVVKDRDGLYEISSPIIQTEFTGTEIITPSMEIQSDRRF